MAAVKRVREDFRLGIEILRVVRDDGTTFEAWDWGVNTGNADLPPPGQHAKRKKRATCVYRGDNHIPVTSFRSRQ